MTRKATHAIDELLLTRWSPRSFKPEKVSQQNLETLFEAARWAPSCSNSQPWRFIYAHRESPHWAKLFDLLMPMNQNWCKNASALICVVSKKTMDGGKESPTYSFDTGAACENLYLQAHRMGLATHAMAGFDYKKAETQLSVPADHKVEAMIAVGIIDSPEKLSPELKDREKPNDRKPLKELMIEGTF